MPDQKPGKLGRVLSFASNKSKKSASNQQPLSPQKISSQQQPNSPSRQQQQQPQQYGHARKNTGLSDKSAERPSSNKMRTHADPTLAMNEAQPSAIALEESSLGQLRAIQHKDRFGNPITEPDLSNPTRYRFERPLDTIRSFEAAIDGSYGGRRMSYARPDESTNGYSRPTSFFGGDRSNGQYYQRGGYDSYSASRGYQSRPESYVDAYGNGNGNGNGYGSTADMNQYNYSNQRPARAGPPRQAPPRTNSDPNYGYGSYPTHNSNPANSQYPQPQYQGQPDNPNSNSPSGSGGRSVDHWVNSTDPSSVNSSMDRLAQQQQQQQLHPQGQGQKYDDQLAESYGLTGFGTDPQLDQQPQNFMSHGQENIYRPQQQQQQQQTPPSVPRKNVPAAVTAPAPAVTSATLQEGKRKSWFKRRISKS
ncbi:hypothetical protein MGYG_07900 [Nannizzia gypsea CBS 118893]|uniref:Uncharacterized protein n=1 Tax=Arthroderma gypseum (strain ATCC MYA-4604 / CBS 118893) TaxID=535722 RepID=E4V4H4_ARTGP|nr:hypothetical protein MGYG_07900 [Nannizzia gypsea CBS 118893]EFR04898.1 hypothetical protein MGYG_07900 [Nannizzia gypsea CBS 118893]